MAYFFLILYIICTYIRPQEWSPFFYGSNLMIILALISLISWFFELIYSRKKIVPAPQNLFMILFLAAITASVAITFYFGGALSAFNDFGKTVLIYFLIGNLLATLKKIKFFIWVLILLSLFLAVDGIRQYYTGVGLAGQTMIQETRIRGISIFGDPNDLALTLILVVPFLLIYIFNKTVFYKKIFSFIILCPILYAVWLTNSRGGILSLGVVTFFFVKKRLKNFWGILIGILLLVLMIQFGPSRMNQLTVQEESAYGRIAGMSNGFWLLRNNPLLGSGYGSFSDKYYFTAHNSIMLVAGETGMIGLFFYIGLIYFSIKNLSRIERMPVTSSSDRSANFATALKISLIGFLVGSFFLSRAYNILLYIMIGLSVALVQSKGNAFVSKEYRGSLKDALTIIKIEIAVLIFLYILVRIYY